MTPRIASLHVYPVKGCRGLAPASAAVAETGLVTQGMADREWMVVDRTGRFVTQREYPRLALVDTAIVGGVLRLSVPERESIDITPCGLEPAARAIVVWQSEVRGFDAGNAAADWLSAWLAAAVRLVRFDRAGVRACNRDYAGDSGAHTLFADGYPVLVTGQASLADLNARLAVRGSPGLPMNRFRPNVVIDGLDPFAEDHLDTIAVDGVVLKCVKPCVRCQVTTTDQGSAHVGLEPLRTLGEFRMNDRLGGVTFGVNAIVAAGAGGTLSTGAGVAITYRF